MAKKTPDSLVPGGVDEYLAQQPTDVQSVLGQMRSLIQDCAPGSVETVSYFSIPGYSYPGYDYNGMFAWFSYVAPFVRLHVRPPVLVNAKADLKGYKTTKAIVSFPASKPLPEALIRRLVMASLDEMRNSK